LLQGSDKASDQHGFPLSEAAEAQQQLEARKTSGKALLIPNE